LEIQDEIGIFSPKTVEEAYQMDRQIDGQT